MDSRTKIKINVMFEECLSDFDLVSSMSISDAMPNKKLIKKLRRLQDILYCQITVLTSLGKDDEENLRNWLNVNDVPYDSLFVGYPVSDIRIDRQTMSPAIFENLMGII